MWNFLTSPIQSNADLTLCFAFATCSVKLLYKIFCQEQVQQQGVQELKHAIKDFPSRWSMKENALIMLYYQQSLEHRNHFYYAID